MVPADQSHNLNKSGYGSIDKTSNLLRNVNSADHGCTQHFLLPHHKLLEEVDRDVVVRREKDADVAGEEVVDFTFAAIFGLELLGRDMGHQAAISGNLMHVLVILLHKR